MLRCVFLLCNSRSNLLSLLLSPPQTVAKIHHTFLKTLKMNQIGADYPCTDAPSGDRINSMLMIALTTGYIFQSPAVSELKRPNFLMSLSKSGCSQRSSSG